MRVLCVSLAIALADQIFKILIVRNLRLGESVVLVPGLFSLSYGQNTGAAWGMLQGLNNWLVVLSVVMLLVIVIFRRHFLADTVVHRLAMGLMIGGIAGNLLDRLRLGYVVDFLDFYWRQRHFPAFNLADAAICVGVFLYALTQGRREKTPAQQESSSQPGGG
jgi:signal peptidase II